MLYCYQWIGEETRWIINWWFFGTRKLCFLLELRALFSIQKAPKIIFFCYYIPIIKYFLNDSFDFDMNNCWLDHSYVPKFSGFYRSLFDLQHNFCFKGLCCDLQKNAVKTKTEKKWCLDVS